MIGWLEAVIAAAGGSVMALLLKVASWIRQHKREQAEDRWRAAVLKELRRRN